jgi:hypothetical protein
LSGRQYVVVRLMIVPASLLGIDPTQKPCTDFIFTSKHPRLNLPSMSPRGAKSTCGSCRDMTSTLDGLQQLTSPNGYLHAKLEKGSKHCVIRYLTSRKDRTEYTGDFHVFATIEHNEINNKTADLSIQHPSHNGRIKTLYIEANGMRHYREADVYTSQGEF